MSHVSRKATINDRSVIADVIKASTRQLRSGDYSTQQIERCHGRQIVQGLSVGVFDCRSNPPSTQVTIVGGVHLPERTEGRQKVNEVNCATLIHIVST
jgi:hypothetical protein